METNVTITRKKIDEFWYVAAEYTEIFEDGSKVNAQECFVHAELDKATAAAMQFVVDVVFNCRDDFEGYRPKTIVTFRSTVYDREEVSGD